MTKEQLRSKWYYRFFVVIYISLLLISFLISIYICFNEVGSYQTDFKIKCYQGNRETFFAYQDKNILVSRYANVRDTQNWSSVEDLTNSSVLQTAIEGCGLSGIDALKLISSNTNIFDANLEKVNVVSYYHVFFWLIVSFTVILFIFWMVKNIFFYIVTGKFIQKSIDLKK